MDGMFCGRRLRENSSTCFPFLYASRRMPSNFLSKLHSGPVNRSWVSVAAMGTIQSGKDFGIEGNITEGGRQKAERQKAEGGTTEADGRRSPRVITPIQARHSKMLVRPSSVVAV